MFRCPQILTRSRLLLLREGQLSGFSEHPAAGWQAARDAKGWRRDGVPGSEAGSPSPSVPRICNSNCADPKRGEASFQHLWSDAVSPSCRRHPQVPASANPKAVSAHQDCLTRLQPWRRPRDAGPPSHSSTCRTRCELLQSSSYCRPHFLRPFSSWTRAPWILTHSPSRREPSRGVHQAAPREADVWQGCLSLKNENRCRQSLGPNLKLYDAGGKAANRSQGKKQERWASVLVSLCFDRGEPAVLFTLRSRNLTGRHKGDVSFAGGKSDPLDSDVVATALREAREELGVSVANEQVWGTLKPLRDMSGMMIAPVLANLGPIEELSFKPNPGEVEEIFTLSLSHLCNPQNRGYTHFRTGDKYGYTVPVFRNGKHRVWGLTAVALDHTLKLIVPD